MSWIDYYNFPILEQSNDEEKEEFRPDMLLDGQDEINADTDIVFIHWFGHMLVHDIGDRHEKNNKLVFIGTLPGIGEEIEDQAENGKFAYHYTGSNYFELWLHERFVDFQKIETE